MIKYIYTCCTISLLALFFAVPAQAADITYTYDNAGRLTKADYGEGRSIAYTYDSGGNLILRDVTQALASTAYVSTGNCGGNAPCYHTLAEAISDAVDNTLIKVAAESFEGVTVDAGKTLYFEWGYDSAFESNTGITEFRGRFIAKDKTIIRSGTLRGK